MPHMRAEQAGAGLVVVGCRAVAKVAKRAFVAQQRAFSIMVCQPAGVRYARHRAITDELRDGAVSVQDLVVRLGVSAATIRRSNTWLCYVPVLHSSCVPRVVASERQRRRRGTSETDACWWLVGNASDAARSAHGRSTQMIEIRGDQQPISAFGNLRPPATTTQPHTLLSPRMRHTVHSRYSQIVVRREKSCLTCTVQRAAIFDRKCHRHLAHQHPPLPTTPTCLNNQLGLPPPDHPPALTWPSTSPRSPSPASASHSSNLNGHDNILSSMPSRQSSWWP